MKKCPRTKFVVILMIIIILMIIKYIMYKSQIFIVIILYKTDVLCHFVTVKVIHAIGGATIGNGRGRIESYRI